MRRRSLLLLVAWPAAAQQVAPPTGPSPTSTIEAVADASVHAGKLYGIRDMLPATQPADAILLRFRTALVSGWSIEKAVILLHLAAVPAPTRLTIAAVPRPWNEHSAPPRLDPGSPVPVRLLADGWFSLELPRDLCRLGTSPAGDSFALQVPAGSKLSLHSRRTGQFAPYLLVRGHPPRT